MRSIKDILLAIKSLPDLALTQNELPIVIDLRKRRSGSLDDFLTTLGKRASIPADSLLSVKQYCAQLDILCDSFMRTVRLVHGVWNEMTNNKECAPDDVISVFFHMMHFDPNIFDDVLLEKIDLAARMRSGGELEYFILHLHAAARLKKMENNGEYDAEKYKLEDEMYAIPIAKQVEEEIVKYNNIIAPVIHECENYKNALYRKIEKYLLCHRDILHQLPIRQHKNLDFNWINIPQILPDLDNIVLPPNRHTKLTRLLQILHAISAIEETLTANTKPRREEKLISCREVYNRHIHLFEVNPPRFVKSIVNGLKKLIDSLLGTHLYKKPSVSRFSENLNGFFNTPIAPVAASTDTLKPTNKPSH